MDSAFIRERLFRPFDSTKGLTGMGIGVFETREYIHTIGGEMEVHSTLGKGTCFILKVPKSKIEKSQITDLKKAVS